MTPCSPAARDEARYLADVERGQVVNQEAAYGFWTMSRLSGKIAPMLHTLYSDQMRFSELGRQRLRVLWDAGLAMACRPGGPGVIRLGVIVFDRRWTEISWDDAGAELTVQGEDGPRSVPLTWVCLDLADAYVTADQDDPCATPLMERLRSHLSGPLLDDLAELDSRDVVPRLSASLPARLTEPGQFVGWSEVFPGARRDDYVLADGTRLTAEVLFCSNPDCLCKELTVEFFLRAADHEPKYVGAVQTEYSGRKPPSFYGAPSHAEQVRAAWDGFRARYGDLRCFRDRHARVKQWSDPLWKVQQRGRRVVPRASRNAPCPCGSGQKYKKCCWARDANAEVGPVPQ